MSDDISKSEKPKDDLGSICCQTCTTEVPDQPFEHGWQKIPISRNSRIYAWRCPSCKSENLKKLASDKTGRLFGSLAFRRRKSGTVWEYDEK